MLKAKLSEEEFGQLSSGLEEHYKAGEDGDYVLQVTSVDGFGLDDTAGLKKVLNEVKDERARLRVEVRGYKEKLEDVDVDELLGAHEKVKSMQDWTPDDKVRDRIAEETKKLQQKLDKQTNTASEREKFLLKHLHTAMIESEAITAIKEHEGSIPLLLPHLVGKAKLVEADEGFNVKIVGKDGIALPSNKQGEHGDMGFMEYVGDVMKNDEHFAVAFSGTDASGSSTGSTDSSTGRKTGAVTGTAQDFLDPKKYRAAKKAAEDSGRPLRMVGGNPWDEPAT